MSLELDEHTLRRLWPHVEEAKPGLIAAVVAASSSTFAKYGLTTPLSVAHAMAQFSEEFGADLPAGRIEFEENLNYSAAGIARTWPSRFNSATALSYAHNPRKLADRVYGGRMGNARPPSDDGWNFRGRGASQVTGREGYEALAKKTGLDLLGEPGLVNAPEHFLECGIADFVLCGCLPFAERDDVRGVTHHLNGGYIGLAERERWLARWKQALEVKDGPPKDGALRVGSRGYEVKAAQQRLTELGYHLGRIDGIYGSKTRDAVLAFQADRGLPPSGEIDTATSTAMQRDLPRPNEEARTNATADDLRKDGSATVRSADAATTAAKVGTAGAAAGAAAQEGWLDQLSNWVDKLGGPHEVIDAVKPFAEAISSHWAILAIVLCAVVVWFARGAIDARLDDHRSGANLGR